MSGIADQGPGPAVVDDPADPRLADYRDLKDPAIRRAADRAASIFVVEGRVAVRALVRSPVRIRSLLVDDHQVASSAGLVAAVRARGAPVFVGSRDVVRATVGFALHRGVVAVAERPPPRDPRAVLTAARRVPRPGVDRPLVLVLEALNDHENIGAVFRNAAAFGAGAVLMDPRCADPLYRRSVRVSSGHVLAVPFARLTPWPGGVDDVRAAGFLVAALAPRAPDPSSGRPVGTIGDLVARLADPGRGPRFPDQPAPTRSAAAQPVALLLGAEGPGLSAGALAGADVVVSIPMADGVDSLNVATAAAVALHRLRGK